MTKILWRSKSNDTWTENTAQLFVTAHLWRSKLCQLHELLSSLFLSIILLNTLSNNRVKVHNNHKLNLFLGLEVPCDGCCQPKTRIFRFLFSSFGQMLTAEKARVKSEEGCSTQHEVFVMRRKKSRTWQWIGCHNPLNDR